MNAKRLLTIALGLFALSSLSDDSDFTEVKIGEGLRAIESRAYAFDASLRRVELDDSVRIIEPYAFFQCNNLESINLTGVDSIQEHSFEGSGLRQVVLPRPVVIGDFAFADSRDLDSISLTGEDSKIGDFVFSNCGSLKRVCFYGDSLGMCAFMNDSLLTEVILPDSLERFNMGDGAFLGCVTLKEISIPYGTLAIPPMAFMSCQALAGVSLPEGIEEIGDAAFMECGVTEISFPSSLKRISDDAFVGCDQLKTIYIGNHDFDISNVTLPENVEIIKP
ncbi:MAG: leucine-rich repeat domain-containing protein [Bacteroidales bacterium]|nr:leucine-rich repeat domain-containing protein [Bacteroidales bacterium]